MLEQELRMMKRKRKPVKTLSTSERKICKVSSNSKTCGKKSEVEKRRSTEISAKEKNFSKALGESIKCAKSTESNRSKKPPQNTYSSTPVRSSSNCSYKYNSADKGTSRYSLEKANFNTPVNFRNKFDKFERFASNIDDSQEILYHSTPFSSRKCDKFRCSVEDEYHNKFNRADSTPFNTRKCRFKWFAKNDDFDVINDRYSNNTENRAQLKCPLDDRNTRNLYSPKYLEFVDKYKYIKNKSMREDTFSPRYYYAPKESWKSLNMQRVTKRQLDYEIDSYRWTKLPVTKEELDEDIDRYMSEVKHKSPNKEENDVDSFVQEYMLEIEKCQNQYDFEIL